MAYAIAVRPHAINRVILGPFHDAITSLPLVTASAWAVASGEDRLTTALDKLQGTAAFQALDKGEQLGTLLIAVYLRSAEPLGQDLRLDELI